MKKIIKIHSNESETRIDKWLKRNYSSLNQSFIEKNLRKGLIKVNNKKISAKYKIIENDQVTIFNYSQDSYKNIVNKRKKIIISEKLNKLFKESILYEDDNFLVLDKWSGIATQGVSKIKTSIDHIIKNISTEYNLVHRLDRETSGLIIIAKNLKYTKIFGKLFKNKEIGKTYLAICQGIPSNIESSIKLSIKDKRNESRVVDSLTKYKVIHNKNNFSIILFFPLTGKTHQIRIVSKHISCPIIGDTKYNKNDKYSFETLKLNAHCLEFTIEQKKYKFVSKLPNHFINFSKKNNLQISLKNKFM